jgi:hypothetical protein
VIIPGDNIIFDTNWSILYLYSACQWGVELTQPYWVITHCDMDGAMAPSIATGGQISIQSCDFLVCYVHVVLLYNLVVAYIHSGISVPCHCKHWKG